jgi:hypothetical protein
LWTSINSPFVAALAGICSSKGLIPVLSNPEIMASSLRDFHMSAGCHAGGKWDRKHNGSVSLVRVVIHLAVLPHHDSGINNGYPFPLAMTVTGLRSSSDIFRNIFDHGRPLSIKGLYRLDVAGGRTPVSIEQLRYLQRSDHFLGVGVSVMG